MNRSNHSTPQIIRYIPPQNLPWGTDGILVWIHSGKSALKWVYGPEGEDTYYFLMLNGVPVVKRHSVNSCPTCEEILLAGYGIDKVETSVIENLRSCTSGKINLSQPQVLADLSPLLNLLKPGLYLLSVIPHYPSDGKGGFFWTSPIKPVHQKDFYWHEWRFPGPPTFLVPTQPLAKLDRTTVDFYREEIKEGKRVEGIAYHIEGYMSALLDGHHRATAALYENTPIDCLTILGLSTIWETTRGSKIKNFGFHGYQLKTSEFSKAIVDQTLKSFFEFDRIEAQSVQELKEMVSEGWSWEEKFTELEELGGKLPTIKTFEAIKTIEELGEKTFDDLLHENGGTDINYFGEVLSALIEKRDPRAKIFAKQVALSPVCKEIWTTAFRYLATLRTKEVEDFFVDYLINDDRSYPEVTEMIDEYFRSKV